MSDVSSGASAPVSAPVAPQAAPVSKPSANSLTPAQAALLPTEPPATQVADLKAQAANGTPAQAAAAKKTLKQLKIKFNGKESLEDLPFEIPDDAKSIDYMTRQIQMSKLSQAKAQEYSDLEKEVKSFVEELKKDPRKVLSDPNIGIDVKKLAAQVIEEEINNSQKSPEQLEREKLQAELQAIKDEREREKESNKQSEFKRLQQQEFERYDMLFTQAIEKSDLPKSPYIVKKMSDYMLLGLQQGLDVTPDDVLPLVREEMQNDLNAMFAVMPEEVIEKIIGKDIINKIRKKSVAKQKSANAPLTPQKRSVESPKEAKDGAKKAVKGEKMSFKDFFGV